MRSINKIQELQLRRLQELDSPRPTRTRWLLTRFGLALGILLPAGLWLAGVEVSEVVVPSIVGGILGGFLSDILRDM